MYAPCWSSIGRMKSKTETTKPAKGRATKGRATYQDVLDAPEYMVAEVINGTLCTQPRPAVSHALAYAGMGSKISPPFHYAIGGPGGWWILSEPELHLDEDILAPDLAGWRRERVPVLPDGAFITIPPDWVCEILSPSTRRIDLDQKCPVYAREEVPYMWLIDPLARTLEAFELLEGKWEQIASLRDNDPVSVPPFDAITFNLGDLWMPENQVREPAAEQTPVTA